MAHHDAHRPGGAADAPCRGAAARHPPRGCGASSEAWIAALLAAPDDAEQVIYADPRRGVFRYASLADGRLAAVLFLGRSEAGLPERDVLAALLGQTVEPRARAGLVAAQPTGAVAERGRLVCACFGIGLRALHDAIRSRRLTSAAEIGACLRAGTNCGSCLPELAEILRDTLAAAEPGAA